MAVVRSTSAIIITSVDHLLFVRHVEYRSTYIHHQYIGALGHYEYVRSKILRLYKVS